MWLVVLCNFIFWIPHMENNMSAKQPVLWPLGRILCTLLDAAKSSALNLFAVFSATAWNLAVQFTRLCDYPAYT